MTYQVGDNVEMYDGTGWYPATVESTSGTLYDVKVHGIGIFTFVDSSYLRPLAATSTHAALTFCSCPSGVYCPSCCNHANGDAWEYMRGSPIKRCQLCTLYSWCSAHYAPAPVCTCGGYTVGTHSSWCDNPSDSTPRKKGLFK